MRIKCDNIRMILSRNIQYNMLLWYLDKKNKYY